MKTLHLLTILLASFSPLQAQDNKIPHSDLGRLLTLIKPQPQESPWREINWLTNVTQAREQAIAEDKPLVIFTAADGSPIGRT